MNAINGAVDLCLEELESRYLLAGNVTAAITDGDLVVTGDNQPNEFRIIDNGSTGQIVRGLNGTKVNGVSDGQFNTGDLAVNNISIDANGGDDDFVLRVSNLTGNLDILGDKGNDQIEVVQSSANDAQIRGGIGVDSIKIGQTNLREAQVFTGNGNDNVLVTASNFAAALSIETDLGNDSVSVTGSQTFFSGITPNTFSIRTGSGNDTVFVARNFIGNIDMRLGDNRDEAIIEQTTVRSNAYILSDETIVSEKGRQDRVKISRSTFERALRFVGGEGNDLLIFEKSNLGESAIIRMGNGNDLVRFQDSDFGGRITTDLGNGDDRMLIDQSTVKDDLDIFGRTGNDLIMFYGSAFERAVEIAVSVGDDSFYSTFSEFRNRFEIQGQGGNDFFSADLNHFQKSVTILGQGGTDTYNEFTFNRFDASKTITVEEQTSVDTDYLSIAESMRIVDFGD